MSTVDALQQTVANSFVMYMNYKRYHWNTFGPLFREIHLLFDENAEQVLKSIDEFAERARILGGEPIGTPEEVSRHASIKTARSQMTIKEMIEQAISNHKQIMSEFKDAIKLADSQNDPGTADLFIKIIQVHEKQEWFLREHLKKQDGLVQQ